MSEIEKESDCHLPRNHTEDSGIKKSTEIMVELLQKMKENRELVEKYPRRIRVRESNGNITPVTAMFLIFIMSISTALSIIFFFEK